LEAMQRLREQERQAQAARVSGLHDTYLESQAGGDRRYVSLALGIHYLEASPRLALQYLSSAALSSKADDVLLPIVRYYLAEAKFRAGAYKEAVGLAEDLLLRSDRGDAWRKQVQSLLIESLAALGE